MNRYIYDERPRFESYNMTNFNPGMPLMFPNGCAMNNSLESKISKLENDINNLQNRVSKLEGNIYPEAIDYSAYPKVNYKNSMNFN